MRAPRLPGKRQATVRLAVIAVAASLLVLGGCATPHASAFRDPALTVQAASQRIVPGQSSRADVSAALGPAQVGAFDSGFEVWAYRSYQSASPGAKSSDTELVLLFSPDGILRKTRVRLPPG